MRLLVAALALLALVAVPAAVASGSHPAALASALGTRMDANRPTLAELEGEVMCPVCNTTLDQSNSPIARRIKAFISQRIAAGDSKHEIKDRLVADYGPQILAAPPKKGFDLLAWLLPIVGVLGGALVLAALAWRWSRVAASLPRRPRGSIPLSSGASTRSSPASTRARCWNASRWRSSRGSSR